MAFDLTLTSATYNASGKFGQSLNGGYGHAGRPLPTNGTFSAGIQFKSSTLSGMKLVMGAVSAFYIGSNASGNLVCKYGSGASEVDLTVTSITNATNGAWHEVEFCLDETGAKLFYDGALVNSNTKTAAQAAMSYTGGNLFVRDYSAGGFTWPGEVDQAFVSSVVRHTAAYTPSASAMDPAEAGLIGLWKLDGDGLNSVAAADTTPPTAASAAVANSTPTVVNLTMSEAINSAFVPAASAFTVSGHTVNSVAISGTVISLTCAEAFANGEAARTVAYTQPGTNNVRDVAGNLLANFTGLAVTNNVAAAGDTTPPAYASAQVTNSTPNAILVTFNEALANSVPAASAWTVSGGRTVTAVSISSSVVTLTVDTAYANGDAITVAYTQPGANPRLQDAAGNLVATFSAKTVTNNIAGANANVLTAPATQLKMSPYNWNVVGAKATAVNAGAYFETLFTGTTCALNFDVSTLVAPYPKIKYRVDKYGPWTTVDVAASVPITMPTDTAAWNPSPGHILEVRVKATNESANRWNGTSNAVILTGITLDTGKTLTPTPKKAGNMLVYGDSITEGCRTVKALGTPDVDSHDATIAWAYECAERMGMELGLVGFSAQGYAARGGVGNVPLFPLSYNYIYSGVARSFSPAPDLVLIAMGTNDGSTDTTSAATTVLNGIIAATPSTTKIVLMRPWSNPSGTNQPPFLQAAIAACTDPSRGVYMDTTGFAITGSSDGLHPYGSVQMYSMGPKVAAAAKTIMASGASVTLASRTASITLGTDASTAAANLTGAKVAIYDEATPDQYTVARYQSSTLTTDANGVLTATYGSTLPVGGTAGFVIQFADGKHWNGTVQVT
jgi:lysophospholipase L1-like esterase